MVTGDTLENIVYRVGDQLGCDNLKPIDTEEGGRAIIGGIRTEHGSSVLCRMRCGRNLLFQQLST